MSTVTIAGYETVARFEGEAAAQEYATWAYRVGMVEVDA